MRILILDGDAILSTEIEAITRCDEEVKIYLKSGSQIEYEFDTEEQAAAKLIAFCRDWKNAMQ